LSYYRDGKWTAPVNLEDKINSTVAENSPKISPGGHYFFWSSARTTIKPAQEKRQSLTELTNLIRSPENGLCDIYYMDLVVLGLEKHGSDNGEKK
jgi:hypothetical protein